MLFQASPGNNNYFFYESNRVYTYKELAEKHIVGRTTYKYEDLYVKYHDGNIYSSLQHLKPADHLPASKAALKALQLQHYPELFV